LKNKKIQRKADYAKIKRKLYTYVAVAMLAAVVFVILLREFIQRQQALGDWIVGFMEITFKVRHETALEIYYSTIRSNMEIILCVAVAVCFFFLFRIIISRFMRYFDEVNTGVDALIQGEDAHVEFSAEMMFMERKLKAVRQTLEKREQDARLAEQRKNDVVMYLAHDIKTPLTSVIGYMSLLDEAPDMPVEQRAKYVHITLEKAYRLEQLIDEFFEITRYNLQTITLTKETIDLYYMLVQMADEFYPQLSHSGKRVALHVSEDLTVCGDPDKLARVFNNILKNAVAYSPGESVISITAALAGDTVSIVFTNDGSIPQEKLTSIFDKFYRLDSARSAGSGGAGLGLAIAREIVNLHGGHMYADSDDERTAFTVELPALEQGETHAHI
jgi:two-component system sensor histidine kinase VanS